MHVNKRIDELVNNLGLVPHPEGGFYRETYRSVEFISTLNGERNLMTAIYFLLTSKNVSRFHVIKSDELWFHHEGDDLTIHVLNEMGYETKHLGKSIDAQPQQLVSAGEIFGSTVDAKEGYALVSCVVAPGFDFLDFKLFETQELLKLYPLNKEIIERLT
jgi:uncharacterized protein